MAKSSDGGWASRSASAVWAAIVTIDATYVLASDDLGGSSPFGGAGTKIGTAAVVVCAIGAALYVWRVVTGTGRVVLATVQFAGAAFVLAVAAGALVSTNGPGSTATWVLLPAVAGEAALGIAVLHSTRKRSAGSVKGR